MAGSFLQRFGADLIAAIAYTWAVLRTIGGIVADYTAPMFAPVGRSLRQPSIRLPLLIAGAVALAGGIIRAFANGFERDTLIALVIGIVILGALALAHAGAGLPGWLASPDGVSSRRTCADVSVASPTSRWCKARLPSWRWPCSPRAPSWPGAPLPVRPLRRRACRVRSGAKRRARKRVQAAASGDVEGRGTAVSGDTLRVGATTVRLNGIEAPEPDQTCAAADGSEWSCGQRAKQALARLLRNGRVTCDVPAPPTDTAAATARSASSDVAAELVRGGHVFAASGLFASYSGIEEEARTNKAGIWDGKTDAPLRLSRAKWDEAKRESPDGCPIKGSVRGSRRYYVVPWARGYERVQVSRKSRRALVLFRIRSAGSRLQTGRAVVRIKGMAGKGKPALRGRARAAMRDAT